MPFPGSSNQLHPVGWLDPTYLKEAREPANRMP